VEPELKVKLSPELLQELDGLLGEHCFKLISHPL
jgi:hypothetical protein